MRHQTAADGRRLKKRTPAAAHAQVVLQHHSQNPLTAIIAKSGSILRTRQASTPTPVDVYVLFQKGRAVKIAPNRTWR